MIPEQDVGDLPAEFHERLTRLLTAIPGATLFGVRPGERTGCWRVELTFPDRLDKAVVIYCTDQLSGEVLAEASG